LTLFHVKKNHISADSQRARSDFAFGQVPQIVGNGNSKNKHRGINIWGVSEARCIAISVPITPGYSQQIICLLGEDALWYHFCHQTAALLAAEAILQ
jgi:hypothetical protein